MASKTKSNTLFWICIMPSRKIKKYVWIIHAHTVLWTLKHSHKCTQKAKTKFRLIQTTYSWLVCEMFCASALHQSLFSYSILLCLYLYFSFSFSFRYAIFQPIFNSQERGKFSRKFQANILFLSWPFIEAPISTWYIIWFSYFSVFICLWMSGMSKKDTEQRRWCQRMTPQIQNGNVWLN